MPYVAGLYHELLQLNVLVHGNLLHLANILEHEEYDALLGGIKLLFVLVEELKKRHCLLACGELVALFAENGESLRAVGGGALGGGGYTVIINNAGSMAVSAHFGLQSGQLSLCLFNCHGKSSLSIELWCIRTFRGLSTDPARGWE